MAAIEIKTEPMENAAIKEEVSDGMDAFTIYEIQELQESSSTQIKEEEETYLQDYAQYEEDWQDFVPNTFEGMTYCFFKK